MDTREIAAVTSSLSLAEVLVKPKRDNDLLLVREFKEFFKSSRSLDVVPITEEILERSAEIRASTSLKLPDAIHVATARARNCSCLLTNDQSLRSAPGCNVVILAHVDIR